MYNDELDDVPQNILQISSYYLNDYDMSGTTIGI
jgi:hypothetical protein